MRQVGVLAAAGLYALNHNIPKLKRDHEIASRIGQAVNFAGQDMFKVDGTRRTGNLVYVFIDPKVTTPQLMVERLLRVSYAYNLKHTVSNFFCQFSDTCG